MRFGPKVEHPSCSPAVLRREAQLIRENADAAMRPRELTVRERMLAAVTNGDVYALAGLLQEAHSGRAIDGYYIAANYLLGKENTC